jgi:hypothetical protein
MQRTPWVFVRRGDELGGGCEPRQTNPSIGQKNIALDLTNECFESTSATLTNGNTIVLGQPENGGPAWNSGDGTVSSNQRTGNQVSKITWQNGTIWCKNADCS